MTGEFAELWKFNQELKLLPHKLIIFIAGNHDTTLESVPKLAELLLTNCVYLRDELYTITPTIKIYGSPWQPWFHAWAFNIKSEADRAKIYAKVPDDVQILLTHGPPAKHCSLNVNKHECGCQPLLTCVERVKPKFHVFGHVHEAYGKSSNESTTFLNVSSLDFVYKAVHAGVVIAL
eukprot:TRINITY_DN9964_c0_g1_i1.p1 TRINITY_DN9964_c0_g1~~TRINITY_DN9964_c0_g1_i1.p1  ORF type:complete len:208 (-),score=28.20 TRINITY_DN9964_c0_g1_i1:42-572(-)